MNDPLYNTLCSRDALFSAWLRVKTKNTAGGIDFQTVQEYAVAIDRNLEKLFVQLKSGNYTHQPYREVFIPKNETEKRRLGLLTVNDKIVQTAVTMLITPILERSFLNVSYAYRDNKGPVKAIKRVVHLINNEHFMWLASCDIDNFFDSIPHAPLFGRLSAYLKSPGITELTKMFVKMGRVNRHHHWKDNKKGVPQGGVVSPLLANFYLYPLDKLMVDNKFGFVRYADDFIILGRTKVEAIKAKDDAVEVITQKLGLALNEEAKVVQVNKGFEFLGIYFNNGQIDLSEKKYKRLVMKMSEAAGIGPGLFTVKLKQTVLGIANFYGQLIPQSKLELLDDDLMAVLRLRLKALNPGKNKKSAWLRQLHLLQFLAQTHNAYKTGYINQQFGHSKISQGKGSKRKQGKMKRLNSRAAVLTRKHEYQKLETAGFDLSITHSGLFLGKRDKMVTVRKHGNIEREVPLVNLKNISILSQGVSFSSNLVQACAINKISIDFLGNNGMPYAMIISPSFVDAEIGTAQLLAYSSDKSFYLIRKFVHGKINNQANLIKYYGKYYLKHNREFSEAYYSYLSNMKAHSGMALKLTDKTLDEFRLKMFAVEGQASAKYWKIVEVLVKSKRPFDGRVRQGATDLVNCMLNYGYGILYARITQAIIHARLNPCLSYLHKPEGNRPSLVFDLIEEFRQPVVDRAIFALLMKNKNLAADHGLLNDHTRNLVAKKVIDRINTIEMFRNREMRLYEIIQAQANALAKFIVGKAKSYKSYRPKW